MLIVQNYVILHNVLSDIFDFGAIFMNDEHHKIKQKFCVSNYITTHFKLLIVAKI